MFKNKLLRALLLPFFVFVGEEEGGGGADFNVAEAVDTIGADLFGGNEGDGLGDGETVNEEVVEPATEQKPMNTDPAATDPNAAPAAPEAPPKPAAPKTWRPEAAAEWEKLPPTVQAEITKREADMFSGIEGYKAHADLGKSFQQATAPFAQMLTASRTDPVALTQSLMAAHAQLSLGSPADKLATVHKIAQMYGVELQTTDPETDPFEDPAVKALRTELDRVKSQIGERQANIERVEQQRIRAQLTQEIDAFAADSANVYFDEVSADIVQLLQSGVAKDLKDAYERAVWLNPVTRAKEVDRQTAEKASKAQEEAQKKADEAAKATQANVRTRAKQASGTAALGSIDDTLKQAYAKLYAKS